VFEISVGNIAPRESVVVKLSYAVELQDDEKADEVKFVLPSATFPRYGTPADQPASALSSSTPLTIRIAVQQASSIKKIACPSSHPIELYLGRNELTKASTEVPDSNLASISLSQASSLEKDFILTISAQGLDSPRATIEARPSFDKPETVAMSLTLVPRFQLPVLPAAEWIFVVDRSGSMGGHSMELAKKALLIAIKGLPAKGTHFNIVSFGTTHDSLFSKSEDYSEASLRKSTKEIDGMAANYGGTEIRTALEFAFAIRDSFNPTNVLLFTDGGSYDVEETFRSVKQAVSKAQADAPLRVFTFGIGAFYLLTASPILIHSEQAPASRLSKSLASLDTVAALLFSLRRMNRCLARWPG
jgi:hypothetical protein